MFDDGGGAVEGIPAGLDEMEPGLFLAACLSELEGKERSGYDRVVVLRAHQRMASYFQAQVYEEIAAISDLMNRIEEDQEVAYESAAAEIRAGLRLTRRAADSELAFAIDLSRRLPRVWEALTTGDIDVRRARVIVAGTAHLSEESARLVVERIIDKAARLTTGQLHAHLRRVCVQADPEEAAKRFEDAVEGRRIIMEPTVDGTANLLGLDLPPQRVAAAMRRIADLARSLKSADETRTIEQIRADVLLDLLEGHSQQRGTGRGSVDIQVDLETLTRLAEDPGELAGYGPVIADLARQVAEQQQGAKWRWTVTHPDSGQVIYSGVTRRRPTAAQRRNVESRNRVCIFPGCRMPAIDCDLDHRIPWAEGGPTTTDQLVPLCRHDHLTRHRSGWKHQSLPDGDHQWTSRLGHRYTTSGQPP